MTSSVALLTIILQWVGAETVDKDLMGGWKPASLDESMKYYTKLCTIPKIRYDDTTAERFEKELKYKPFILTFGNGAEDWVKSDFWTLKNLTETYDEWKLSAGKSIEIVYNGGKGDMSKTFKEFVREMRTKTPAERDPT